MVYQSRTPHESVNGSDHDRGEDLIYPLSLGYRDNRGLFPIVSTVPLPYAASDLCAMVRRCHLSPGGKQQPQRPHSPIPLFPWFHRTPLRIPINTTSIQGSTSPTPTSLILPQSHPLFVTPSPSMSATVEVLPPLIPPASRRLGPRLHAMKCYCSSRNTSCFRICKSRHRQG